MEFRFLQEIAAPLDAVEGALSSASFYARLGAGAHLGGAEVLEREEGGGVVRLRVRLSFAGDLPAAARAVVDPDKLSWVTAITVFPGAHRAEFTLVPDHYPDRLSCTGRYDLVAAGAGTRREVAGTLVVRVPLLGRAASRALVRGLEEHFDEQVDLLEAWQEAGA